MIITIDEFFNLRSTLPVVDVRSQGEFEAGHIPKAINIPILTNDERAIVGTDYKEKGQAEAIKSGFRLVGPRLLEMIIEAEKVAVKNELIVHCWRGGMRSENFCKFVGMNKIKTHQLEGGYKSYRQAAQETFNKPFNFIVIGGYTGSGKSEIIWSLSRHGEQVIDLESLASHRGSAFGGLMQGPQPTTEQFQNNLFEELRQMDPSRRIWIEDESISIGKVFIPNELWKTMCVSPVVEIVLDKQQRVSRLVKDYGKADKTQFLESMEKITTKLGGQHFKAAKEKLLEGDMAATIDILLTYYDKAYLQSLKKKRNRIVSSLQWNGKDVRSFSETLLNTPFNQH